MFNYLPFEQLEAVREAGYKKSCVIFNLLVVLFGRNGFRYG